MNYSTSGLPVHHQLPQFAQTQVAQRLKPLPPMQETWVRSLSQEDPLEKEMVTHSSILAWRIPRTEKATVHGVAKSWTQLSEFTSLWLIYNVVLVSGI